jgi:hypothetical protein
MPSPLEVVTSLPRSTPRERDSHFPSTEPLEIAVPRQSKPTAARLPVWDNAERPTSRTYSEAQKQRERAQATQIRETFNAQRALGGLSPVTYL